MNGKGWCLLAGLLLGGTGLATAQMGPQSSPAAMGSPMDPAKAEDALVSMFEKQVVAVAKAMPADKFNFAPMSASIAGAKYEGVRSFSQEVIHITQANYFFYAALGGPKPDVDVRALSNLKTKDEIVSALEASFVYAHKAVTAITPANAFETIKGVDGMQTRATVASFAVAHGYDHYGQLVEYLRMNGVVPPGSK